MTFLVSQSESIADINKLRDVFNLLDETHDGHLDVKEMNKGLRQVFGNVKGNLKVFEDIMESLDKNLNGLIDYTEFITAASDKAKLLSRQNLEFAFNMIDKDKDGQMTKEELREMFEGSE